MLAFLLGMFILLAISVAVYWVAEELHDIDRRISRLESWIIFKRKEKETDE